MERYSNIYKSIVAVLLIVFLSVVFLLNITMPDKVFSESENRVLQQRPEFSFKRLAERSLTIDYEKYISDQIAARDFWVGIKSATERIIGRRDSNGVYLGKDGFLLQIFEKPESESIKKSVEDINSFSLNNPGLKTYFILVPNSVEILKDKLPPFAPPARQLEYINRIKSGIGSNVKFVDVYDTLLSRNNEYIYYKTDHHWTTKGAYYAYEKLSEDMGFVPHNEDYFKVRNVSDSFYGSLYSKGGFRNLKPDSMELCTPELEKGYDVWYYDKNIGSDSLYNMDNLSKKDKYTVFLDGNHSLIKITSKGSLGKKLVVAKDSYANCLIPFLTGHYSEIYVVDLRYFNDSLSDFVKSHHIPEMIMVYNVNTFFEDSSLEKLTW